MKIGPRKSVYENQHQHIWYREINGVRYAFIHVKVSPLGGRVMVEREDPETWTSIHEFTA